MDERKALSRNSLPQWAHQLPICQIRGPDDGRWMGSIMKRRRLAKSWCFAFEIVSNRISNMGRHKDASVADHQPTAMSVPQEQEWIDTVNTQNRRILDLRLIGMRHALALGRFRYVRAAPPLEEQCHSRWLG